MPIYQDPFEDDESESNRPFQAPPIDLQLYGFHNYHESESEDDLGDEPEPTEPLLHEGDHPMQKDRKKRAKELSRDERIRIRCLHRDAGWIFAKIYQNRQSFEPPMPTLTIRQIQFACDRNQPLTPRKGQKMPIKVTDEMKEKLAEFLKEKPEHRLIPWIELPYWIDGFEYIRDSSIRRALKDMGYLRKERQKKIVHTEVHEAERLKWAEEHKDLVYHPVFFIFHS